MTTTKRIAAKLVQVHGVDVDDLRYPPQSYLVLDGVAHEVTTTDAPGHASQRKAATRGGSLVKCESDVECAIKDRDGIRARIVAYLPASDCEVGYAETTSPTIRRMI